MNRRKILVAVVSVCAVLVANTVIASSQISNTPLFTFRMEQASNRMNFLPTAVNGFTYTTENGCTLNNAVGHSGEPLEVTVGKTCEGTCVEPTCPNTCLHTCAGNPTCSNTCPNTCGSTCDTCEQTCDTCDDTCVGVTCPGTCLTMCIATCFPSCLICG